MAAGPLSYTKSVALSLTSVLGLCRRRGWGYPMYETYKTSSGYMCHVLVHGRDYQTDLAYIGPVGSGETTRHCQVRNGLQHHGQRLSIGRHHEVGPWRIGCE